MGIYLTVGSIYLNETLGGKYRIMSNSLMFIFWGSGGIIVNVHSIWFNYYKDYFCIQFIGILIPFFLQMFLPKTPFFLYSKKQYKEMGNVLNRMATFNNVENWEEKYQPMLMNDIEQMKDIKIQRASVIKSNIPEQSKLM